MKYLPKSIDLAIARTAEYSGVWFPWLERIPSLGALPTAPIAAASGHPVRVVVLTPDAPGGKVN